jgi:signal transduction histidine kinase
VKHREQRLARLVVALCVLFNLALLGLGGWHLAQASFLDVVVAESSGDCPWVISAPGDDAADSHVEQRLCLRSIGSVRLEAPSLVAEPAYLGGRVPFERWREHQRALQADLDGRSSVLLGVEDIHGNERVIEAGVRGLEASGGMLGFLPMGITALVVFLIGSLVYLLRPDRSPARALFALCQGTVLCFVPSIFNTVRGVAGPTWSTMAMYYANTLGILVGVVALTFLAATFPVPQLGRHTRKLVLWLPLSLASVAFLAELAGFFGAGAALLAPLFLVALVLLVRAQLRPATQLQRLEARWILWGLLIPVVVFVVTRVPLLLGTVGAANPSDELMAISAVAIPVGIAVAVLRYRLLDIELVIRRTILGAVVTMVVLFFYHLTVAIFAGGLSEQAASKPMLYTVLVSALVLTIVVGPVQARLEAQLDRLFFRNRFHYRRVLARVPDGLALLGSPDAAAEHVLSSVGEAMELGRMLVALVPEGGKQRLWTRDRPGTRFADMSSTVEAPAAEAIWRRIADVDGPYLCDTSGSDRALDRWMEQQGLVLVLPLRTPEALVGLLACSGSADGKLFAGEDIDALRSVASSLALAMSHALAYETIRVMNEALEQRIEQRTAELEKVRLQLYQWEKMASLGVLAAGVAHELNTPLGVVLSAVEQLSEQLEPRESGDEVSARLLELAVEAARRASLIIRDLRSFSRPESSAVQSLDLHECIESTLRLLGPSLRAQKIEVSTDLGEIPCVEGFPALFNQTLTNLILNAAAAIKSQGNIRISTMSSDDGRVRVVIEDSGPGIPEELRSRIFEPFYTTKAPGEGTGLGLSLCYTFVTQHGGRIWEEGEPGKGARFVVELPLRLSPEQREQARAPYELTPRPRQP